MLIILKNNDNNQNCIVLTLHIRLKYATFSSIPVDDNVCNEGENYIGYYIIVETSYTCKINE